VSNYKFGVPNGEKVSPNSEMSTPTGEKGTPTCQNIYFLVEKERQMSLLFSLFLLLHLFYVPLPFSFKAPQS
jgi:hypothetical protein